MNQEFLPPLPPPVIQSIEKFKEFVKKNPGGAEAVMAKVLEDHEKRLITLSTNLRQMMSKMGELEGAYNGIANAIYEIMMEKESHKVMKASVPPSDRRSCVSVDEKTEK